jgi:hypothetical protein
VPSSPTGAGSLLVALLPCSALRYGCPGLFTVQPCLRFCTESEILSAGCSVFSSPRAWLASFLLGKRFGSVPRAAKNKGTSKVGAMAGAIDSGP